MTRLAAAAELAPTANLGIESSNHRITESSNHQAINVSPGLDENTHSMVMKDLNGKPFQLKFVRAAQMQLFTNAVCDPPLGSTTVVPYGETVPFIYCREPTTWN